jgi:hypothetical protein
MANRRGGILGWYVLRISLHKPGDIDYLVQLDNNLSIGNVDLGIFTEHETSFMAVSFKAMGINTFNVVVINLDNKLIRYWHESYQLWESQVTGFCLKTNDFLILNSEGVNVLVLGQKANHEVTDSDGQNRLIHSLGSCNYLKVEPSNMVYFQCQFYEDRQICI